MLKFVACQIPLLNPRTCINSSDLLSNLFLIDLENTRSQRWNPSVRDCVPAGQVSSAKLPISDTSNRSATAGSSRQLPAYIGDEQNEQVAMLSDWIDLLVSERLTRQQLTEQQLTEQHLTRQQLTPQQPSHEPLNHSDREIEYDPLAETSPPRAAPGFVSGLDSSISPIVLWGPGLTGKTRFAEALAHRFARLFPSNEHPVLKMTCGDFGRQFGMACRTRTLDDFWFKIDSFPILLLDNLHELGRYSRAAAEMSRFLDRCHSNSRFVLFTSRFGPNDLNSLQPRFLSRICGGITVRLNHPGPDARIEIARSLNDLYQTTITDSELISRCQSQCQTFADIKSAIVDHLKSLPELAKPSSTELDHEQVIRLARKITAYVAQEFGLSARDLRGSSRKTTVKIARNLAILLIRRILKLSYKQIGTLFGHRDHSTILNAFRQINDYLKENQDIRTFADSALEKFSQLKSISRNAG